MISKRPRNLKLNIPFGKDKNGKHFKASAKSSQNLNNLKIDIPEGKI